MKGLSVDGALWRLFCGYADRSRVRQVPLHGLVPYGDSPVSVETCLDPACLGDPSRFYPAPPPIRPDVWETIDQAGDVEIETLAFRSAAPFGIAPNEVLQAMGLPRPVETRRRFALGFAPAGREARWAV